jgi:hypothetical protein
LIEYITVAVSTLSLVSDEPLPAPLPAPMPDVPVVGRGGGGRYWRFCNLVEKHVLKCSQMFVLFSVPGLQFPTDRLHRQWGQVVKSCFNFNFRRERCGFGSGGIRIFKSDPYFLFGSGCYTLF